MRLPKHLDFSPPPLPIAKILVGSVKPPTQSIYSSEGLDLTKGTLEPQVFQPQASKISGFSF